MRKQLVYNNETNRYVVVDISNSIGLETTDYSVSTMYNASILTEIVEGLGAPIFGIYDLYVLSSFKECIYNLQTGKVNEKYVKVFVSENRSALERIIRNIDQMLDFANFRNFMKRAPMINIIAKFVGNGTLQEARDMIVQWL